MFRDLVSDVFFDLDHTLWDFERNSALTFREIFQDNNINLALSDFLQVYIPVNLSYWKLYREERITKNQLRYERLKLSFDTLSYPISDSLIHKLSEAYILRLSSHNNLLPNTVEILEYLRPKYKLHIITNGFEEIQNKKMRNANIMDYFDQIINSEMAGVKKPNPIIFELALEKAQVLPNKAIMIGDSLEADIIGARAVGLHTLHLNAHNEPDHQHGKIIFDLREIKNYL